VAAWLQCQFRRTVSVTGRAGKAWLGFVLCTRNGTQGLGMLAITLLLSHPLAPRVWEAALAGQSQLDGSPGSPVPASLLCSVLQQ
jgi:hypothetical protein